jgi:hypothetical protein
MSTHLLQEELKALELRKRELQKQLDEAQRDDTVDRLKLFMSSAVLAHDLFCCYNHTDGCSWLYEQSNGGRHDWGFGAEYSAHQRWLLDVERVCKDLKIGPTELHLILEYLAGAKKENPRAMEVLRNFLGCRR